MSMRLMGLSVLLRSEEVVDNLMTIDAMHYFHISGLPYAVSTILGRWCRKYISFRHEASSFYSTGLYDPGYDTV